MSNKKKLDNKVDLDRVAVEIKDFEDDSSEMLVDRYVNGWYMKTID